MFSNGPYIKLTGVKDPAVVEMRFATYLVDVAAVDKVVGNTVVVVVYVDDDFSDEGFCKWITEIIRDELIACGEGQANIELVKGAVL